MGLTIRMLLALSLAIALWVVSLGALVYVVFRTPYWFLAVILLFGFAAEGYEAQTRKRKSKKSRNVIRGDTERVKAALQRLSMVGGLTAPQAVVEPERAPLSWTLWAPGGKPRVHVTTGLLDRLDDTQLEAVVAHELMHVVNRDAKLMTFIGALPSLLLSGLAEMLRKHPFGGIFSVLLYGLWFTPTAVLLLGTARIVSRQRELVADRGAAQLTGSPAAVAGVLISLSDDLTTMRDQDLRQAGRADLFHFLPKREPSGLARLWATHPRLEDRLEHLERMERDLQG